MNYPTGDDLTTYLTNAGLLSGSQTLDVDGLMAAAIKKWERDTGYSPYLVQDADTDKTVPYHIPRRGRLFLRNGLQSVTSIVRTDTGATLVEGTDYRLPLVAPYTEIHFRYCIGFISPFSALSFWDPIDYEYGYYYAVNITGKWGKTSELPADVSQILIRLAAHLATAPLEYFNTDGVNEIQTLGTTFKFGGTGKNYYERTAEAFHNEYVELALGEKLFGLGN